MYGKGSMWFVQTSNKDVSICGTFFAVITFSFSLAEFSGVLYFIHSDLMYMPVGAVTHCFC